MSETANTARLFNCNHCHIQAIICNHCDHGHIYCSECAPKMRAASLRRAGTRYQQTMKGRQNHAARQKRFREKLRNKVTHQGSSHVTIRDVLKHKQDSLKTACTTLADGCSSGISCHLCGILCSPFIRLHSLNNTT
jgi:hypothetical protein